MSQHGSRFDLFRAAAEAPRALALVTDQGSFSYEALARLGRAAAAWLSERGISKGSEPVAVLARPTPPQVAMCHALWALRVPLLPVHPSLTCDEQRDLLSRANASVLVDETWEGEAPGGDRTLAAPLAPDDETLMALIQTSGSTGRPRLCQLSRRAFSASAEGSAARLGWQRGDRWLLCLPFAHVGGLSILSRCLARRATVAMSMGPAGASSTQALLRAIAKLEPTLISVVPTQLVRLLAQPGFALPKSVRLVLVGGAELMSSSFELARARGWPVVPSYGLTEACSQVATAQLGDGLAGCGAPLDGVELRLRDGQIEIRGDVMFSGYLGESARTPCEWFASGDLGRLDEAGRLHVMGRQSERIVTGGENVDPLEVERMISDASQRRLCVAGRPHLEWGEQVVVFIEGPHDPGIVRGIVERAQARLAPFKRPRLCAFVSAFPVGLSGKVKRGAMVVEPAQFEALIYPGDKA